MFSVEMTEELAWKIIKSYRGTPPEIRETAVQAVNRYFDSVNPQPVAPEERVRIGRLFFMYQLAVIHVTNDPMSVFAIRYDILMETKAYEALQPVAEIYDDLIAHELGVQLHD